MINNIIRLEFHDKSKFAKGPWSNEPDLVGWYRYTYPCLAIRESVSGTWKGFVGLPKNHAAHGKTFEQLLECQWFLEMEVYGGISYVGKLTTISKDYAPAQTWWLAFDTNLEGEDLSPIMLEKTEDGKRPKLGPFGPITYKDLHFVRREVNDLARQLFNANQLKSKE